jgi:tetratricopeptide (TPR) repeat protein
MSEKVYLFNTLVQIEVQDLHREAMGLHDEADALKRQGKMEEAIALYNEALEKEIKAYKMLAPCNAKTTMIMSAYSIAMFTLKDRTTARLIASEDADKTLKPCPLCRAGVQVKEYADTLMIKCLCGLTYSIRKKDYAVESLSYYDELNEEWCYSDQEEERLMKILKDKWNDRQEIENKWNGGVVLLNDDGYPKTVITSQEDKIIKHDL